MITQWQQKDWMTKLLCDSKCTLFWAYFCFGPSADHVLFIRRPFCFPFLPWRNITPVSTSASRSSLSLFVCFSTTFPFPFFFPLHRARTAQSLSRKIAQLFIFAAHSCFGTKTEMFQFSSRESKRFEFRCFSLIIVISEYCAWNSDMLAICITMVYIYCGLHNQYQESLNTKLTFIL